MQDEILKKYGKYIAFALMTFGGSALTLYSRFQMTEIEIENIEKRLEEEVKIINKVEERIHQLELQQCK
jgi:CRISPR/Cas system-associated protein Cas10 (large subunit of type III CRISPR-Cas system)